VDDKALEIRDLLGQRSIFDAAQTDRPQSRSVFVGYPYKIPADDYRSVFNSVSEEYDVSFVFANDELTKKHILEKIAEMIRAADFSLFDITYWNPNVALELGIAVGGGLDFYILFDPSKEATDVLSDLRGIDRINYTSYKELRDELARLIRGQYGAPQEEQHGGPGGDITE
jgi:hypothetical protein